MPYKTKAELERERWMTLPEAVAHIRSVDKCNECEARRQLIAALADGVRVLGPLKWEREPGDRGAPFGVSSITGPTGPPLGGAWSEAEINSKTGRVRDDWDSGKWRVLLILRQGVLGTWQSTPNRSEHPDSISANVGGLATANAGGRPSSSDQVYDELWTMQKEGCDMSRPQKRLAEEVAKRLGKTLGDDKTPGDPGWSERTIIQHVRDWLRDSGLR
jgi:hypothetical protein